MIKRLYKNPAFMTGFIFLTGLFLFSVLYLLIKDDKVPQLGLLKDNSGQYLKVPYSPIDFPPLGSDNFNRNMLFVILVGAKYTIGAAFIISLARIILSFIISLFMHFYLQRSKKFIISLAETFHYFPQTLLAFLLLEWMLRTGPMYMGDQFPYTFAEQVGFYIIIIILIGLPALSILLSNEIDKIMNYEFIASARVLGASRKDLIITHLRPFIVPQLFIVWIREFIAIMILISHLGMLEIFMGGAVVKKDFFQKTVFFTNSNEWSGLLGSWISFLWTTYPWIAFIPIIFFTLTIIAAKLILKGLMKENTDYFTHKRGQYR